MNDFSNKEQMVYDYIKEVLRSEFPNSDVRDDSEFMETFGLPHVKLLTPVMEYIDRMKLQQNLSNATLMTNEEMDEVAAEYYTPRKAGERSTGFITLVFNDVPESGMLVIPAGIEAVSKNNLLFSSTETMTLGENDLIDYYNPSTFGYEIAVPFRAVSEGEEYNIKAGDITDLSRPLPYLEEVFNESDFFGGTDTETNFDLAVRIRQESYAPNLGNTRGYQRFFNSFDNVKESRIVGYGHPLMKRDVIGKVPIEGLTEGVSNKLHWGGKVDAYVRGEKPEERTEFIQLKKEDDRLFVELNNKPVLEILDIRLYSPTGEFDDPEINQDLLFVTNFYMEKEEDFETRGTLEEKVKVYISDERLSEGSFVRIRYHVNALIQEIHDVLYLEAERPPTADVKVKEANRKFVYGALTVKLVSPFSVRESDRNVIRQRTGNWIDSLTLGGELQFSDIQNVLSMHDEEHNQTLVDYIHMPYQFLVFENQSRMVFNCLDQEAREFIKRFEKENTFLEGVFDTFKDKITVYDLFDILHSLTAENGFDESAEELQYENHEWGAFISSFRIIREMTMRSGAIKRMSPAKQTIQPIEYFDLGEVYVYEDKDYDVSDWRQIIDLYLNLMDQENIEPTERTKEMYRLAIYVLVIVFMATDTKYKEDPKSLYRYLQRVVASTPIEHEYLV